MKEESVNMHRLLTPITEVSDHLEKKSLKLIIAYLWLQSSNQLTQQSLGQVVPSNTSVLEQVSYSSTPLETAYVSHPDDLRGTSEGALSASVLTDEDGEHEVDAGV
jgi:hypothetical protein